MGTGSEQSLGNQTLSEEQQRMSRAIEYLYGREDEEDRNVRGADLRDSNLTVPLWINEIHEPQKDDRTNRKRRIRTLSSNGDGNQPGTFKTSLA
ncbi:uncharacterized protein YehP domain protein [Leptospira santarosai str. HAI134]|nr:uncharacterized protein YehP domain protein [Leptospira santarosai str. HAI134]